LHAGFARVKQAVIINVYVVLPTAADQKVRAASSSLNLSLMVYRL
jgi:hypothetical protein